MSPEQTEERFGEAMARLLVERGYGRRGKPNVLLFVQKELDQPELYEAVRKGMLGQRPVLPPLLERVAAALELEPSYFLEYRLHLARSALDPREVGWAAATENLCRWEHAQALRGNERGAGQGRDG
jgi:hypothetical protein